MKIDSKPNIASELTTTYVDENVKERVRDAAVLWFVLQSQITFAKRTAPPYDAGILDFAKLLTKKIMRLHMSY